MAQNRVVRFSSPPVNPPVQGVTPEVNRVNSLVDMIASVCEPELPPVNTPDYPVTCVLEQFSPPVSEPEGLSLAPERSGAKRSGGREGDEFVCALCGHRVGTREGLRSHIRRHH